MAPLPPLEASFPRLIELQLRNLNVNHALMLAPWVTAAQAVRAPYPWLLGLG